MLALNTDVEFILKIDTATRRRSLFPGPLTWLIVALIAVDVVDALSRHGVSTAKVKRDIEALIRDRRRTAGGEANDFNVPRHGRDQQHAAGDDEGGEAQPTEAKHE
jgi:hypothetical protein